MSFTYLIFISICCSSNIFYLHIFPNTLNIQSESSFIRSFHCTLLSSIHKLPCVVYLLINLGNSCTVNTVLAFGFKDRLLTKLTPSLPYHLIARPSPGPHQQLTAPSVCNGQLTTPSIQIDNAFNAIKNTTLLFVKAKHVIANAYLRVQGSS